MDFTVASGSFRPMAESPYPSAALAYSRGPLEMVAYVVVVAPDPDAAVLTYETLTEGHKKDHPGDTRASVDLVGVRDSISFFDSETPATIVYFMNRNVVGIVYAGGLASVDAEYYAALFKSRIDP